jgi:hypothetical protein
MARESRKNVSDNSRETYYLFPIKVPFNEAFPEIEDIFIEVKEFESSVRKPENDKEWEKAMGSYSSYPMVHRYSKNHLPAENINCTNALCFNGGLPIGSIVRGMISKKETFKEGIKYCRGYEGSPKGKSKYRDCSHQFEYKITIKYYSNSPNK